MTGCSILDIGTSINRIETISSSDFARVLDPYHVLAARDPAWLTFSLRSVTRFNDETRLDAGYDERDAALQHEPASCAGGHGTVPYEQ